MLAEGTSDLLSTKTPDWQKSDAEEVLKNARLWDPNNDTWLKDK